MSLASRIGKKGLIKNGRNVDFFVRIDDDSQNTGGFLILIWKEHPVEGYDYWVESLSDLEQFLSESGWEIEWLE